MFDLTQISIDPETIETFYICGTQSPWWKGTPEVRFKVTLYPKLKDADAYGRKFGLGISAEGSGKTLREAWDMAGMELALRMTEQAEYYAKHPPGVSRLSAEADDLLSMLGI